MYGIRFVYKDTHVRAISSRKLLDAMGRIGAKGIGVELWYGVS